MVKKAFKVLSSVTLLTIIFFCDGYSYIEESHETVVRERSSPDIVLPEYCYWLDAVSVFGDTLYLNDGSGWKVSFFDRDFVSSCSEWCWGKNTPLLIMKNNRWFKFGYDYVAYNLQTGEQAAINLVSSPEASSPYLTTISEIDDSACMFTLNNGTRWLVTGNREEFYHWLEGDGIVIGSITTKGYSSNMELLFINTYRKSHVKAMKL